MGSSLDPRSGDDPLDIPPGLWYVPGMGTPMVGCEAGVSDDSPPGASGEAAWLAACMLQAAITRNAMSVMICLMGAAG